MPSAQGESLEEAAMVHGIDADVLTAQINDFFGKQIRIKPNNCEIW